MLILKWQRTEIKKEERKENAREKEKKKNKNSNTSFFTPRLHTHHHQWWPLVDYMSAFTLTLTAPGPQPSKGEINSRGKAGEKFCQESLGVTAMEEDGLLPLKIDSRGISHATQIQMSR